MLSPDVNGARFHHNSAGSSPPAGGAALTRLEARAEDDQVAGDSGTYGLPLRSTDPQSLGPYRLLRRLGEGGMGCVYLAETGDGHTVAVKVIRADLAEEQEFRRRFRSEVARAQEVPPFCTAEVLDADPDHETPYLVVEFVDGPSLSEVVLDRGPLTPSNLYGLAIGVATALTAIHGAGVIHRDLKPSNVLLAPGTPKVIDFGIARAVEATDSDTRTDQLIGTVAYMAPERLDPGPRRPLTAAADIFAWGVVVTFAATGRVPFLADSSPATAVAILTQAPDLEGIPEPLRGLVTLALAKNPRDRPTARDLLDRLLQTAPRRPGISAPLTGPAPTGDAVVDPAHLSSGLRLAYVDVTDPGSRPAGIDPTRVGWPDQPLTTVPGLAPRASGWWRAGVATLVVAVLAMAATIIGMVYGVIRVPGASADPSSSPISSPAPSVTRPSFPVLIVTDPLIAPGNWFNRDDTVVNKSSCTVHGGLTVDIERISSYRCPGPKNLLTDFQVDADVTLVRDGSCASMWLRFAATAGYALRMCQNEFELLDHNDKSTVPLRTSPVFVPPILLGTPFHVQVTVLGPVLTVSWNGAVVFQVFDETYTRGNVVLGIFQVPDPSGVGSSRPPVPLKPWEVVFANVKIYATTPGQ